MLILRRPFPPQPLRLAAQGQELELISVQSGQGLALRLAAIGLVPGARFILESGGKSRPVLVSVGGARLILGSGVAHRMLVRPVGENDS